MMITNSFRKQEAFPLMFYGFIAHFLDIGTSENLAAS